MKNTSIFSKLVTLLLTACLIFGICQTAFAADMTNDPYGYTYDDAANGHTMYKYYSYNSQSGSYSATRVFYSEGTSVYIESGNLLVSSTSAGSGSRYNGFGITGIFYMITSNGGLISIDSNNMVNTILASGAMNLNYNYDDLAETVTTTSGTLNLSTLSPTTPTTPTVPTVPNQPGTIKTNNRVEIYTNSAGEMVYTAYSASTVKVSITVSSDGLKILNTTNDVRLSDTLKGVKFMGIDSSYNVYMYETNGTLYRFIFGNWYSAEKIVLDGKFKTMRTDENGFLSTIITDKTTYTLKQLTPSTKWEASYTYAVTKDVYATLYTKGSAKSTTLMLTDGILTLNGKEVDDKVTAFGFISESKFCYIRNGKAYTAPISDPTDYHRLCSDAVNFKMNDIGLVTKVVLSTGKTVKAV